MIRPAIAVTILAALLTAAVVAGIVVNILPARAMPVLRAAWAASLVICVMLWVVRWAVGRLLGNLTAVRDLSGIVANDLTRGAGSRREASLRQAR